MFRTSFTPKQVERHNIRNRLLQFDSQLIRHKNAPWTGERYACVFYNKDLNYADSDLCDRSNKLKRARPTHRLHWIGTPPAQSAAVRAARARLLDVLRATRFPEDRTSGLNPSSKYGTKRGTFLAFGVTKTRKNRLTRRQLGLLTRKHINVNNAKYPTLYNALCEYINLLHPDLFGTDDRCMYHACIVAKNSQCEWHVDAGNVGPCVITSLGNFRGGGLLVDMEKVPVMRVRARHKPKKSMPSL